MMVCWGVVKEYIFFFLEMWRVRYARFRFVVLRKYQTKIKRKKKDTTKPSKKTNFFFLEGEEKRLKFNEIFAQHIKKKTLKEILKL